jgi:hypothetical protein
MTMLAATIDPPATNAADLSPAEEIVLWSLRTLVENRSAWREVKAELRRLCGLIPGEAVALGLGRVLDVLGSQARRDLMVHQPHCACVGEDEQAILNLVAAAQAGRRDHVDAIAGWLVPRLAAARLAEEAAFLADALAAARHALRVRAAVPQPAASAV